MYNRFKSKIEGIIMWQNQVDTNRCFEANFKIGDTFEHREVTYKISGMGHTHVVCTNESCYGIDKIFSKKDLLRKKSRGGPSEISYRFRF